MPQDDEIYFKIAADLSDLKPQFQDLSNFWDKHNQDIAKGEKAYRDYGATTEKVYQKVNQKIKDNIGQVVNEGKALENLEKKFANISKKTSEAFDSKEVKEFQKVIKNLGTDMSSLENLNLSVDEIDTLSKKLGATKDDFEALNVVVDFFEQKIKKAATGSGDSLDSLKQKIERTTDFIGSLDNLIKDYDNKIDSIAPGRVQSGLIGEQNQANKSLQIQKALLAEYKKELKEVNSENVNLTTQLSRVKDAMVKLELEGKRNTDQYEELKDKAEEYKKVLKVTNDELNRSASSTAGLDTVIGAATSLVAVFSAAQGAQALFGSESEDLGKALVKLTGAIALLNGLQSIQSELAKKDAIATRGLAFVKTQYAVATNSAATATARFGAALKLTGIGLIIAAIAGLVVYWDDIKKAIGGASDESERNNEINAKANEILGDQRAELSLLIKTAKAQTTTLTQQKEAVKSYNEEFGETFGKVKDFKELQEKLIESGPDYVKYLELKAKAEAAYQIALEKTKNLHLDINRLESGEGLDFISEVSQISDEIDKFFGSKVGNEKIDSNKIYEIIGLPEKEAFEKEIAKYSTSIRRGLIQLRESQEGATGAFENSTDAAVAFEEIASNFNFEGSTDGLKKEYKGLTDTLEALIKRQRDLKTSLIGNDREREKQILQDQIADEKAGYEEKIKNLQGSEEKKLQVIQEFNRIYNEETGTAYEQLRQNLKAIDDKYNAELEKVKLTALQGIDEVFLSDEEKQRKAIKDRFEVIRKTLFDEIEKTNNATDQEELAALIITVDSAEEKETKDFDLKTGAERIKREKKTAEAILKISQINNKAIIKNEALKQFQLLALEEEYLKKSLDTYRDSLKNIDDKSLFENLIDTLATSVDPDVLKDVAEQLKKTFGEEIAQEILETVGALKEVKNELKDFKEISPFEELIEDIGSWTSSLESFSRKLAETLGLQGNAAKEFAEGVSFAIASTFDSLKSIFDAEIDGHREKLNSIQDTIDGVEDELEREKELYEEGYANNYEARSQDLENLKEQKKKEEEELKKAQKRKAALQKAELLLDSVSQLGSLITASANIFKWASKIPFVGVPLAIGLIGTMFGAFAIAKTKAFQSISSGQNFRTGLQKGRVSLSGPSHEEGGYGVHDSRTGNKVAEVENNEDLIVLNKKQQRSYNHLIDAMIADSRGGTDIETSIRNHYNLTKSGPVTMGVVERVNTVIIKAQTAKGDASSQDQTLFKEVVKIRERLDNEFLGYKEERDNDTKTWETPEFYHVKKGNTIKKYPKK